MITKQRRLLRAAKCLTALLLAAVISAASLTFFACKKRKTFSLHLDNGSTVQTFSLSERDFEWFELFDAENPEKTNYHFVCWENKDGVRITPDNLRAQFADSAAVTFYARWQAKRFKDIELYYREHLMTRLSFAADDSDYTLPIYGAGFGGWYLEKDFSGAQITEILPSEAKTQRVYGKFSDAFKHITVDTNDKEKIEDKVNYVPANIRVRHGSEAKDGEPWSGGIRLRGNSTLGFPKKAYRIKFDAERALIGDAAYKSWALLADYSDPTLMKNFAGHAIANRLEGIDAKLTTEHVLLTVNGELKGVYLVTDQVQEAGSGRVPIKIKKVETVQEPPFLLEIDLGDNRADGDAEGIDFFRDPDGASKKPKRNINIKYPEMRKQGKDGKDLIIDGKPVLRSQAQFDFIKNTYLDIYDLFQRLKGAADAREKQLIREELSQKVDLDSLFDYFILLQIMHDHDDGLSFYMYRPYGADQKLHLGPGWDFDGGMNEVYSVSARLQLEDTYAAKEHIVHNAWYKAVMADSVLKAAMDARWRATRSTDGFDGGRAALVSAIEAVKAEEKALLCVGQVNFTRCLGLKTNDSDSYEKQITYKYADKYNFVSSWLEKRLTFLDKHFSFPINN